MLSFLIGKKNPSIQYYLIVLKKNVSWEEYTSNLPEGVDINKVKLSYNLLPIHNIVNYTEDDLELFES